MNPIRPPLSVNRLEERAVPANLAGAVVNGSAFFAAATADHPYAVWRSDGTAAGTTLVADLPAPRAALAGTQPFGFATVGNRVVFVYEDIFRGNEPWVTDGTPAGTRLLADLAPGFAGSNPMVVGTVPGKALFTAVVAGRTKLYATDGTPAGTLVVRDFGTGFVPGPGGFAPANGKVYFVSRDESRQTLVEETQIWATDGTAAGTKAVVTLPFGVRAPSGYGVDAWLTAVGPNLIFLGETLATGRELWTTDGTTAGTKILRDINADTREYTDGTGDSDPQQFAVIGSTAYFVGDDGGNGRQLWATDGTPAGTRRIEAAVGNVDGLRAVGSTLYFTSDVGTGRRLFASDGTAAGTRAVLSAGYSYVEFLGGVRGGKAMFALGYDDRRVYVSDGTAAGTVPLRPGVAVVRTFPPAAVEGAVFRGNLASVTLPPAADYTVTVNWGDGRPVAAGGLTRTTPTGSTYVISGGQYSYPAAGSYTITVRVSSAGEAVLETTLTATVADARFYAGRVAQRLTVGTPFTGVVATIQDTNPGGSPADFTATVDWGDGRQVAARIRRGPAGKLEVVADATFTTVGRRTVTVTVRSATGRATATAASIFTIDSSRRVPT